MRHPRVLQLIMDSLRYWVLEMHVDGFRFDLASTLARELHEVDRLGAFFDIVHQDPVLSQVKLIAEPWDLGVLGYRLGEFPAGWSEWNGKYRDAVRRFWAGLEHAPGDVAQRIGGSLDLYPISERGPAASVNFVTSHDGFTMRDLVSYAEKHNEANGEGNQDGDNADDSLNFGVEGDTNDEAILDLRDRQRRALLATLLASRGATMLLSGDEMGRTQLGNNNAYSQDNEVSWLDWRPAPRDAALLPYVQSLIALRRAHPLLRYGSPSVVGTAPLTLLITAEGAPHGPDDALLLALNPTDAPALVHLPAELPDRWILHLDSADADPGRSEPIGQDARTIELRGRSVVLLGLPSEAVR
jgi:glycogen operon protein